MEAMEIHRPTTLEEAVALGHRYSGDSLYFAGGTDVIPGMTKGLTGQRHFISLQEIPELSRFDSETGFIGSMVRLSTLEKDPGLRRYHGALAEAARSVASPQVRNAATLGGNLLLDTRCSFYDQSRFWRAGMGDCLKTGGDECKVVPAGDRCYAVYSGDTAPALMVLGAEVDVAGPQGRRTLELPELFPAAGDGVRRMALSGEDLLVSVRIPRRVGVSTYLKLRPRSTLDFPEASVAIALNLKEGKVEALRIAASGLESRPVLFDVHTQPLAGAALTSPLIENLSEQIYSSVRPVANTFFPADYRRNSVRVLVKRGLLALQSKVSRG